MGAEQVEPRDFLPLAVTRKARTPDEGGPTRAMTLRETSRGASVESAASVGVQTALRVGQESGSRGTANIVLGAPPAVSSRSSLAP